MVQKAFLSPKEIEALQQAEAKSDKKQKRTPEQIEAIYTYGSNVLVSASAGSGKTFVMVERIMDKLLRGVKIERLFISTFTVKAAGELKERLEKKITQALQETTNLEEKTFLSQQLVDLQTADIGTMDAFTQKLVNQFGYHLGISPQFRIMQDKSEQDILKNEVFSDLFADYMAGKQSRLFLNLVKNFAGQSKDAKPFKQVVYQIYQFSQATENPQVWLRDRFLAGAKTFKDFSAISDQEIQYFLDILQETAQELRGITALEGYKQCTAKGSPTATYKKHLAMIDKLSDWALHFETYYGRAGLGSLAQDVANVIPSGDVVTVAGVKYPLFKALHQQVAHFRHLETILRYQPQSLPLLELLQQFVRDFSDQYLQAKRQENAFEFSDIAHFAIRILEENTAVRDYYQQKYHEVMVDEYQDNSHTQERLLELLSTGTNRFMVGDIKQSIYRFRQADPQIFNQTFQAFQKDPAQGKLILLKENFRSHKAVLETTNRVFTHLMDETVGEIVYDQTHQLLAGSARQMAELPENQTQVLIYGTDVDENDGTEDAPALSSGEIKLVAKEIIRLHQEEKVAFEDITLLVSSRTRNAAIFRTFEEHGIPLVADDGEQNYLKSIEIMVMLDTLRSIDNPLNDYALVALLRSPMFTFDEDELARLSLQGHPELPKQNLYEKMLAVQQNQGQEPHLLTDSLKAKLDHFFTTFLAWRSYAKSHSLYDLIWKIYNDKFYYDYVGSLTKAEQGQANLYALALRANQFEQTGFKGLSRFIKMIDKVLENDNDLAAVEVALPKHAVNLMTIHKSKGLEFKYVFILNLDKKFSMTDVTAPMILSRQNGIGIKYVADMAEALNEQYLPSLKVTMETLPYQRNKEELKRATLSEQMRLLYVAMTRAEKKLYLVGKGSQSRLADYYETKTEHNRLPVRSRENFMTFQDWILAIEAAFRTENLHFQTIFVTDDDLEPDKIGKLDVEASIFPDNLASNRQTTAISQALDSLEAVDKLNQRYQAAIHLPTLQTPSQLKRPKLFEAEAEGIALIANQSQDLHQTSKGFALPQFSKNQSASPAEIGSALHELMQRIEVTQPITLSTLRRTLDKMPQGNQVKRHIDLAKIIAFFETDLGQLFISQQDRLHREAPFALLKKDPASGDAFVVRGIIDGYFRFDDHIILFDYKTDHYQNSQQLQKRYQEQMALYQEALQQAYGITNIEKYLILFGGENLALVRL